MKMCPIVSQVSSLKFQVHKKLPELGVSGPLLQFELTDSYEKIHKPWSSIEDVPYCLPRSSVKFTWD